MVKHSTISVSAVYAHDMRVDPFIAANREMERCQFGGVYFWEGSFFVTDDFGNMQKIDVVRLLYSSFADILAGYDVIGDSASLPLNG